MIADKCILLTLNVEKITIKTSSYSKYGQNLDEPLKHFAVTWGVFIFGTYGDSLYHFIRDTRDRNEGNTKQFN